jgi:hypothetical protein
MQIDTSYKRVHGMYKEWEITNYLEQFNKSKIYLINNLVIIEKN